MADSYVTSGAKIKCSCGDKMSTLTVYPERTGFLTDKPVANVSDHTSMYNIAPFGKCHTTNYPPTGSATSANHGCLTPMPCVPGTHSKWENGKNDYIIKGDSALLKSSYCRCCYGGIITIVDDGQVDTGDADLSRKSAETEEEWKEKEQEELLADKEGLLDGIQTALYVAGFAPSVGAIADLINAAIYAVRGDKINAGLSLLAAVPGIGDAAAAAKIAVKGVKAAKVAECAPKAASSVKFGELTKKNAVSVAEPATKSTSRFGDLTRGATNTATTKSSSTTQHKFGELTQNGRTNPITKKNPELTLKEASPTIAKGSKGNKQTDVCNDGALKEVFKYKGNQPKPNASSGKKIDLSF